MLAKAIGLLAFLVSILLCPAAVAGSDLSCGQYAAGGQICTIWVGSNPETRQTADSPEGAEVPLATTIDGFRCRPETLFDPQPARTLPVWEGHLNGAIYRCLSIGTGQTSVPAVLSIWLASPPAVPDAEGLARTAVSQMGLRAITIGIVPEPLPGRVGIIGLPTWMWVDNPTETTLGPISRTASAGGYSVTAIARVSRIVWSMGDGTSVTCTGPGTRYEDRFGKTPSPTCGHRYSRQGTYTVRATSYWDVTWSGVGRSGHLTLDLTSATTITMGEIQVLAQ